MPNGVTHAVPLGASVLRVKASLGSAQTGVALFAKTLPLGACAAARGEGCIPVVLQVDLPAATGLTPPAIVLSIVPPAPVPAGYAVSLVPAVDASATAYATYAVNGADHAACNSGESWNATALVSRVCFAGEYRLRVFKPPASTPSPTPHAGGVDKHPVVWIAIAALALPIAVGVLLLP